MSRASDTLLALAKYNSWRRGDETLEMPPPEEIGATIDDAVNLLRRFDETERAQAFYRGLLEQISKDPRRTRARRLAESGLLFWDAMQEEAAKNKVPNVQDQTRPPNT